MTALHPVREIADLTDPGCNQVLNMTLVEARRRVADADLSGVREIAGAFAFVTQEGQRVRMARSLGVPLRYFLAKLVDGPALVAAHTVNEIGGWLRERGLSGQFHPSYTRMVPAHHVTEIALVGCPDPNPVHRRFFAPERNRWSSDLGELGRRYVLAVYDQVRSWLASIPADAPIGVCFSGGTDSGTVLLMLYRALLGLGQSPSRLKAFTLSIDGKGEDLTDARRFLKQVGLDMLHEPVDVPASAIDYREAIRVVEDYKPLDIQAAAMVLALARAIRRRYPDWTYLVDGDGGDENLKDYPIEENPELTIRSVINNRMLYHEGWGVDCVKHSLTYSGGLSRACARTFAPLRALGFVGFSPMISPDVIEAAEGIPFAALVGEETSKLYALKGDLLARGVKAVTGIDMPVSPKRRFQHGAASERAFVNLFPRDEREYRQAFQAVFDG